MLIVIWASNRTVMALCLLFHCDEKELSLSLLLSHDLPHKHLVMTSGKKDNPVTILFIKNYKIYFPFLDLNWKYWGFIEWKVSPVFHLFLNKTCSQPTGALYMTKIEQCCIQLDKFNFFLLGQNIEQKSRKGVLNKNQ